MHLPIYIHTGIWQQQKRHSTKSAYTHLVKGLVAERVHRDGSGFYRETSRTSLLWRWSYLPVGNRRQAPQNVVQVVVVRTMDPRQTARDPAVFPIYTAPIPGGKNASKLRTGNLSEIIMSLDSGRCHMTIS